MVRIIVFFVVLFSWLLTSCIAAPQPTATPTVSNTPFATLTPTSAFTATPITGLVPRGTPEAIWNELPIMPGALAGSGDVANYRFTIKATPAEIRKFYEEKLNELGWVTQAVGDGSPGTSLLTFTKDTQTLSISIVPLDDLYIVMLVQ